MTSRDVPTHRDPSGEEIRFGGTRFAKKSQIVLMRRKPQTRHVERIPIDYDLVASGKRQDMNVFLLPGDAIYVP